MSEPHKLGYYKGESMNESVLGMKPYKRRGEWAELKFMTAAAEHGLCVTKPWGDSSQFDFVVEHQGRLSRVQVKSTTHRNHGSYTCRLKRCKSLYASDSFDFLALFVVPEDIWFIIPEPVMRGRCGIALYPQYKKSKYERYREAWDDLKAAVAEGHHSSAEGDLP